MTTNAQNRTAKIALAEIYSTTGRLDKGIATYEDALKKDPSNTEIKKRLAGFYLNGRSYARGQQLVDEVIKVNPKETDARVLKARLLIADGKPQDAITLLQAVTR